MDKLERCKQLLRMKVNPERLVQNFPKKILEKAMKETKKDDAKKRN